MLQSVGIDMLNVSTLGTPLQDPSVTDSGHTACLLPLGSWPVLRHWIWCAEFRKRHSTHTHTHTHTQTLFYNVGLGICENESKKRHDILERGDILIAVYKSQVHVLN
jgi:hypothetical protein